MKKILLLIIMCLSFTYGFSYNYPIDDKYSATIIGSFTLMTPGVSENVPRKTYKIKIKESVPDILWYGKDFAFSLVSQKKKAPLVFLFAGTGSDYNSIRVKYLERILYDGGYNVISISSPMSAQFLISASKNGVPGLLENDSKDIYEAMKLAYQKVKNKIEVSDFYLVGYSLGATNAAFVSFRDSKENFFNFKRVFMINPAVDLYNSSKKLDDYLNNYTGGNIFKLNDLLNNTVSKVEGNLKNEYTSISGEKIFSIAKGNTLTPDEKKAFIGLAFRLTSIDLNFISDLISESNVYVDADNKPKKYESRLKYFKKVNFASFDDYIERIAIPYYKKKDFNFTKEALLKEARLSKIEDYLKNETKIVSVTNADELILSKEELQYLKDIFKDRIRVYPKGGHCGNMFYKENVDVMLHYLETGELINEK